jgi:hypothetical protein
MKLSSIVCASVVALSGFVLTADCAFAASKVIQHSNLPNNKTDPTCPAGETAATDPATGKRQCVMPDAINYNASKSNTGSIAAPAPGDQQPSMAVKTTGVPASGATLQPAPSTTPTAPPK